MEHFDIVLTLARIALDNEGPRAIQQIERLREILSTSDKNQSAKLGRLLSREGRKHTMAPLAMEEMRATAEAVRRQMPGELLSHSTVIPTDRETGTPLVRIAFPETIPDSVPILNGPLTDAISDLLMEWMKSDDLALLGAKPNSRCLIYGPPGVGKTKLARYIAKQLGLPCVEARLEGLVSSFLGTTARNIGSLFDFANRYRCVLFLDEFDAVAKARDDAQEIGEIKRVVNTLLQSMDARNGIGITLAATNHEQLLDVAVWRRFDSQIEIRKPETEARERLIKEFLAPVTIKPSELKFLVWATQEMSGADIENLIDAGKRFWVLHGSPNESATDKSGESARKSTRDTLVLQVLRRQAALNARLFTPDRTSLFNGTVEGIDKALKEANFNQSERGTVLGISQSAVSRREKRGEEIIEEKESDLNG